MFKVKSSIEKEWYKLQKQEIDFLVKNIKKEDSKLNQLLEDKVPEGLQGTLNKVFYKSFKLIFEKGTDVIELTYNRDKLEKDFLTSEFAADLGENHKTLKAFSSKAKGSGTVNTLISGASGIGMGILGIGIPDIFIFTGMILKNVYQIALNFGYEYDSEEEKKFILMLIKGAVSTGNELRTINDQVDKYIDELTTGKVASPTEQTEESDTENEMEVCIKETAESLSQELLYMKFLQGIPFVGSIGGLYNAVYMQKISKYAELKYRRRFYQKRMNEK